MSGLESTRLFGRSMSLQIGVPGTASQAVNASFDDSTSDGLDVSGFDVEFQVEKTLKPEPNTCDIRIYNLNESSRQTLSGEKSLTVKLEAGYQTGSSLIYLGQTRAAWTERSGPDFITHIESGDSEKEIRTSRLTVPLGAQVPIGQALSSIVQALGVGQGNVPAIASTLSARGVASIPGGALTGSAALRLTDFCRSANLEWSIQDGAVQILDIGKTISTQAILISPDTGLIESPTVDSDGIVNATTLIIPGLQPGVLVRFDSLFVQGGFRVQRVKWIGQIWGNDWKCDIECKRF